jgi:adenosylcobinamide kinase/adenosylcobinamide-phosphate guanylyltransferase
MALIVFTGGARSGKSAAAERLALLRARTGVGVTVAVFGHASANDDGEFAERIARHRRERPTEFATLEAQDARSWRAAVPAAELVVVECLGTLLSRVMEEAWDVMAAAAEPEAEEPEGWARECTQRFAENVDWLLSRSADTIVVTNEVGDGVVPEYPSGRLFRDLLGEANRQLVERANAAHLVVAGRLIDLAGLPADARWP